MWRAADAVHIDLRGLEPPELMMTVLQAIESGDGVISQVVQLLLEIVDVEGFVVDDENFRASHGYQRRNIAHAARIATRNPSDTGPASRTAARR